MLRDATERPEGVTAGTLKIVGTSIATIEQATKELLDNQHSYEAIVKQKPLW